jgi:hypothetical protein
MRRNQPEADLQRAVVQYLAYAKPACIHLHVPNGGARPKVEAAILTGLGVRAGAPDLVLLSGHGSYCIELKVPGGRQSPAQRDFELDCVRLGIRYAVCTSINEVDEVLREWGLVSVCRVKIITGGDRHG